MADRSPPPPFPSYFSELDRAPTVYGELRDAQPLVTASIDSMPISTFLRHLSDKHEVSLIADEGLDGKTVTLEVTDQPLDAVLGLVARRLGVELTQVGGMYYLGQLRNEDRGVLVRKVRRLDADGLRGVVGVLLSTNGRMTAFPDGVVVVGDRVEVLGRVAQLLDQVEQAPADSWVVQLHLLAVRERSLLDAGVDVEPLADVAARVAYASGSASSSLLANAGFNAFLRATREGEAVRVLSSPLLLVLDGESATFRDGDELRIPRRVVSDQGTVTTVGFETVQTGFTISIDLRELAPTQARVGLAVDLSQVVGFSDGSLPTVNRQSLETVLSVRSASVYLVGALERQSDLETRQGILQSHTRTESDGRTVQVWLHAYRIAAPLEVKSADHE